MKRLYIIIAFIFGLLLSCKQEVFQKEEQNPLDFTKLVSIEDLVQLYELDQEKPFEKPLFIEASVNGIDRTSIHIQDNSEIALRIPLPDPSNFEIDDLVRVKVGEKKIEVENAHYVIRNPSEIEVIGKGASSVISVTQTELSTDIASFTSKVIRLNDLSFQKKEKREDFTGYLIEQDVAPNLDFWVNIPDTFEYEMPMAISSAIGFVSYENENVYINVRFMEDIQEVYVPPALIDRIIDQSGLVRQLINVKEDELSEGVNLLQAQYLNEDNLLTAFTLFEVDLNSEGNSVEVGLANNGNSVTSRHSLVNMATTKNDALMPLGYEILGGINGDFFSLTAPGNQQGAPFGAVIKDGEELKSTFYEKTDFFGIKKDNTPLIGNHLLYDEVKESLEQALGGRRILNDGKIVNIVATRAARSAIGYAENNKVYLFVGDGIAEDPSVPEWSNGFNTEEIAELLRSVGVLDAVYLQGGRYAMAVMKNSSTNTIENVSKPIWNHDAWMSSSWLIKIKKRGEKD